MTYNPEQHHWHSIRLKGYNYSTAGAYFVTVCTKNHRHHFGNIIDNKIELAEIGKIVNQFWTEIPHHFSNVLLDEYTTMPNHLHGIIFITDKCRGEVSSPSMLPRPVTKGRETLPLQQRMTLGNVIGYFKYQSTKCVNKTCKSSGITIWQRNYYEHIIRNEKELNLIREYIINNPLQWQFDRENPEHVKDKAYDNQWGHFEEALYGKAK